MVIERTRLVNAIRIAQEDLNNDIYKELLSIYYKLLKQEDISKNFIAEFTIYENISESALQLLANA